MCDSCYHNPDASLADILMPMPWLALLSTGILRTTGGYSSFLASPSGRQERRAIIHIPLYFSQQNNWFYHWVSWFTAEANSTAWIPCSITPAWHPRVFERLFELLFDRWNLWEGELSAAKGWQGKFSLATHLNWVCWCLLCTKTSNLIWSACLCTA